MQSGELSVWFGGIAHRIFAPPVRHYANILLTRVAPIFDDVEAEQQRSADEVLAADGWGPDDYEAAIEAAYEISTDHAIAFFEMRSVFLATGVSGLFHLFEKQLYKHLNHELRDWLTTPVAEWKDARILIEKLDRRYGDGDAGELARNFGAPDLKELQLVANAIKHGQGPSYARLQKMGARVVDPAKVAADWTVGDHSPLAVPIVVEPADIERYRDAILQFWKTEGTYWAPRSAFP